MRGKGINYDTGFYPGGDDSRPQFDPAVVAAEMRVIAADLHCTAVRITGGNPDRLSVAAELAAAEGLEVWFAPFPCELAASELAPFFDDCADRAEQVRRTGATVVLVTGCELSLFGAGFLPGDTVYQRIARLQSRSLRTYLAFARLHGRLSQFLTDTATSARRRFGGPVTYAAGHWEPVDWSAFDIVSCDAYRDSGNAANYRAQLRKLHRHGKPVAITEFGCCAYAGAAGRGGMGWAIVDRDSDPPQLDGEYVRDEGEQVRYLAELTEIFREEGIDLAFWYNFAAYLGPRNPVPRLDLDLASYGVVSVLPGGPGQGYQGLGWEPRPVFRALAQAPVATG